MRAFRDAVEIRDFTAIEALLADDVVFVSPVAFSPYPGKAVTLGILRTVADVFEGFRYVRGIEDDSGNSVLVFEASVAGRQLTGCDVLRLDDEGRIAELMVMVRPLSAAVALSEQMGARFAQVTAFAEEYAARQG